MVLKRNSKSSRHSEVKIPDASEILKDVSLITKISEVTKNNKSFKVSEVLYKTKNVYNYIGRMYYLVYQRSNYELFVYIYFDNGWVTLVRDDVRTPEDFKKAHKVATLKAREMSKLYDTYYNKTLPLPTFYKHIDYVFNTLSGYFDRSKLTITMKRISNHFEPNYAYFLDLIGKFMPYNTTIPEGRTAMHKLEQLIIYPPDLSDYEPKENLFKFVFTNKKRSKLRIGYENFLKSIEHLSDEQITDMCERLYNYEFTSSFNPDNLRKLLYKLTHDGTVK